MGVMRRNPSRCHFVWSNIDVCSDQENASLMLTFRKGTMPGSFGSQMRAIRYSLRSLFRVSHGQTMGDDRATKSHSGLGPDIERAAIERQLQKILASTLFRDAPRTCRFLKHIVHAAIDGRADKIKGYTLGIDVFDRSHDFNPVTDTIVRVQANKLRSRLDQYYADEGRDDPVRVRVPKGRYIPFFEIACDPTSDSSPPGAHFKREDPRMALVVMPFENLSNPEHELLAIAFTEEIIAALSKFRELRVMSRHVTARYTSQDRDPIRIGAELGVRYVVAGTFWQSGHKVRIAITLTCAKTGDQVLSERFDRDLSAQNLLEIQDDIASLTAVKIAAPHGVIHRYGARQRAETNDLDAYQARLLASEYWWKPCAASHKRVRTLLKRAVEHDPNYAGAWAMLALIYGDEVRNQYNQDTPDPLNNALVAAERAVELDDLNATGLFALAVTQFGLRNHAAFEDAARRAVKVNPNDPDVLAFLAFCRAMNNDQQLARAEVERALELCPNAPGWFHSTIFVLEFMDGRYDLALESARRFGHSVRWGSELFEALCLSMLGLNEEAEDCLRAFEAVHGPAEALLSTLAEIWNFPAPLRKRFSIALSRIPKLHQKR